MGRTKTGRPLHIATRLGPSSSAFESKLSVTHLAQLFVLELRLVPPELQTDFGDLHHMPKRQLSALMDWPGAHPSLCCLLANG